MNTQTKVQQNFKEANLEMELDKVLFCQNSEGETIYEIWKDVPNYEKIYQVSNFGRVKSLHRFAQRGNHFMDIKSKIISQFFANTNYHTVGLHKKNVRKPIQVHQLMAIAFLNHVPCGFKKVVDHKDNNPLNNRLDNLQITTNRHNASKDKTGYTSKYIGVNWRADRNTWRASIYHNGKNIELGHFTNEKEASTYYQNALKAINEGTEIQIKRKTNTSEYRGVYKKGVKWGLQMGKKYMGSFDTPELANERKMELLKGN